MVSDYSARRIYYYRVAGGLERSHNVSQSMWDIAYDWRNHLIWGGYNSRTVYGFTTNGSLRASFNMPSVVTYVRGMAYQGQYLWVSTSNSMIYQIHCPQNLSVAPASLGKIKAIYD